MMGAEMKSKLEVRIAWAPWYSGVEVLVHETDYANRRRSAGVNVVMKDVPEGAVCEPTLRLTKEQAQRMFDDLWHCGFRASSAMAGDESSTRRHLEDMRQIAFHKLGIKEKA